MRTIGKIDNSTPISAGRKLDEDFAHPRLAFQLVFWIFGLTFFIEQKRTKETKV